LIPEDDRFDNSKSGRRAVHSTAKQRPQRQSHEILLSKVAGKSICVDWTSRHYSKYNGNLKEGLVSLEEHCFLVVFNYLVTLRNMPGFTG
jgi:hypothetical protein